jgi:glycine oxidase
MSLSKPSFRASDVVVVGAGLIGLGIALELADRGAAVTVIDRGRSLAGASTAAAGMLAAEDPGNPRELQSLSRLSIERYPGFLRRIEELSGIAVAFQTDTTIQHLEDGSTVRLAEQSLDPRELAAALYAAVRQTSIELLEETPIASIRDSSGGITVQLGGDSAVTTHAVLYAAGAWTSEVMSALDVEPVSIHPRKGQMLRVRLPFPLNVVHRSERVYIVPRTLGPQAGTALIGATVEDAGFDTSVRSEDLNALRALAAELLPEFASASAAPLVEAWAGLRPTTLDGLPIVGACMQRGRFVATGHYRNGILQAPGTAVIMADLLEGKSPAIDTSALSPLRFVLQSSGKAGA